MFSGPDLNVAFSAFFCSFLSKQPKLLPIAIIALSKILERRDDDNDDNNRVQTVQLQLVVGSFFLWIGAKAFL